MMLRVVPPLCVLGVPCGGSFAATPTVETPWPAVGQRGTVFKLTLTGARLTNPQELLIYSPGVTCTQLEAKGENEVTVTLHAARDCRLGEYAFRLRTAGGAFELRTFRITPLPVVEEKVPNDEKPQPLALNTSVAGVIELAGVDHYAVTLMKGQRLSAEVDGICLGADLTDTIVTV